MLAVLAMLVNLLLGRLDATDMAALPLYAQLINLFAAILLLLAFAMLAQRRVLSLIDLFAAQGLALALLDGDRRLRHRPDRTCTSRPVSRCCSRSSLLPWLLYRLIRKLDVKWDVEGLINIPTTMLIGIVLVVFSFNLAVPISQLASTVTRVDAGHRDGDA